MHIDARLTRVAIDNAVITSAFRESDSATLYMWWCYFRPVFLGFGAVLEDRPSNGPQTWLVQEAQSGTATIKTDVDEAEAEHPKLLARDRGRDWQCPMQPRPRLTTGA